MYKLLKGLMLLIGMALLTNCQTKYGPSDLDFDENMGVLEVMFLDKDNKNLVTSLLDSTSTIFPEHVIEDSYDLYILRNNIRHFRKYLHIHIADNDYYLSFSTRYALDYPLESPMELYLQCEKIFGDDRFHRIETTYKQSSESVYICSYFAIDGKEYPVNSSGRVTVKLESSRPE